MEMIVTTTSHCHEASMSQHGDSSSSLLHNKPPQNTVLLNTLTLTDSYGSGIQTELPIWCAMAQGYSRRVRLVSYINSISPWSIQVTSCVQLDHNVCQRSTVEYKWGWWGWQLAEVGWYHKVHNKFGAVIIVYGPLLRRIMLLKSWFCLPCGPKWSAMHIVDVS